MGLNLAPNKIPNVIIATKPERDGSEDEDGGEKKQQNLPFSLRTSSC